jgi:hypothetical protein
MHPFHVPPALPAFSLLPLHFDVTALQTALDELPEQAWVAHFNSDYFSGDWSGIALLAPPAAGNALLVGNPDDAVAPTPMLLDFPFWRSILDRFPSPISSARLLRLGPGARIREHCDPDLGRPDGDLRLHIPIRSHPAVEFILDGEAIPMQAGECWFLDLSRPHRVENRSEHMRVHLVLDCRRDAWLLEQIAAGLPTTPAARPALGAAQFALFRERVHGEPALRDQLVDLVDAGQFADKAVELGVQLGLHFSVDDVQAAMRQGRRSWAEQWGV